MKGDITYISQGPDKLITKDGSSSYVKDQKYIGALKYHFRDYPQIIEMADKAQYTHESMIKLEKAYHDLACTSGQVCIIFESKDIHEKYKIRISPYIGYNNLSSYEMFNNGEHIFEDQMNEHYPVIGAQMSFCLPRISQSFSLDLDISLSSLKGREEYLSGGKLISSHEINSLVGFVKAGPGYTYHKGRIRPTLEGGFAIVKIFDPEIDMYLYQSDVEKEAGAIDDFSVGFYIAAGIKVKVFGDNFVFIKATYDKYASVPGQVHLGYLGARVGYTF